jgi:hypothetical protein
MHTRFWVEQNPIFLEIFFNKNRIPLENLDYLNYCVFEHYFDILME